MLCSVCLNKPGPRIECRPPSASTLIRNADSSSLFPSTQRPRGERAPRGRREGSLCGHLPSSTSHRLDPRDTLTTYPFHKGKQAWGVEKVPAVTRLWAVTLGEGRTRGSSPQWAAEGRLRQQWPPGFSGQRPPGHPGTAGKHRHWAPPCRGSAAIDPDGTRTSQF